MTRDSDHPARERRGGEASEADEISTVSLWFLRAILVLVALVVLWFAYDAIPNSWL